MAENVKENNKRKNFWTKLVHWYVSRDAMPYWSVLLIDCLFVIISGVVSYALVVGGYNTMVSFYPLLGTLCVMLIGYLVGFRIFHTYSGIFRLSSFIDLQKIALAVIVGVIITIAVNLIPGEGKVFVQIPPLVALVQGLITMILMWLSRIWGKMLYEGYQHRSRYSRAFVYGTKAGGVAIAKSLNTNPDSPYIVAGFVSDDPTMFDKRLMGVCVYPNDSNLLKRMEEKKATTLVVSPLKSEVLSHKEQMVNDLIDAKKKIMVVPEAIEWDINSEFKTTMLREVNVEDLLPRHKIEVDMEEIARQLEGKCIMITGAAGSIGSEMVRQIATFKPSRMILIDQAETPLHDIRLMMKNKWPELDAVTIVSDISNEERMADIFETYRPVYVFHAAAYKHVPMMEDNPNESIYNNVRGTKIMADLSVKTGVKKFVMVSTDKAVNPTNVMGCSKRICEIYVQSLNKAEKEGRIQGHTQFVTTRFGNVLGSNGSVIPLFKDQIKKGGPVTVTHPDIIRFFMLIPEACKLVLEAGTMGNGGEIFVFDMGKPVKIVDLARRMIRLSGAKDIEVKFTGLRDGEKLYEEVLSEMEQTKPTFHPKIMIANVREYDFDTVSAAIDRMISECCHATPMHTVGLMKALVPEFKSQHSVYEVLDK